MERKKRIAQEKKNRVIQNSPTTPKLSVNYGETLEWKGRIWTVSRVKKRKVELTLLTHKRVERLMKEASDNEAKCMVSSDIPGDVKPDTVDGGIESEEGDNPDTTRA